MTSSRHSGKCKKFLIDRGFGFITCSDKSDDVFVHRTELKGELASLQSLKVGQTVEFDIVQQDDLKRKAINVTIPGANPLASATKIGKNVDIVYGDGGEAAMRWEIYVLHQIEKTMNMELVSQLKKGLIALGQERDDWRIGEPIQNIIDPDLFVLKLYEKNRYWLSNEHYNAFTSCDEMEVKVEAKEKWNELRQNDQKGFYIRRRYQWLATQFIQTEDGNIQIISPIHNLSPRTGDYALLYQGIEHAFECMLPLFNQFPAFRDRKSKEFQVIVKSQRYEVEDMSGYNGHWHQEGLTENIIIGGLYYFEKDSNLSGGSLRFRNKESPTEYYQECAYVPGHEAKTRGKVPVIQEVEVMEGTALVFDNVELVHRVKMLKNKVGDQQRRYRSFLAFFIVDPEKPIKSTREHPSLKKESFVNAIIKHTPISSKDIAMLICDYAVCGYTLEEAKEMRERNIECRKKPLTKGKWGEHSFGNGGDRIWYGNGKLLPPNGAAHDEVSYLDEVRWISTTNSGLSTSSS